MHNYSHIDVLDQISGQSNFEHGGPPSWGEIRLDIFKGGSDIV